MAQLLRTKWPRRRRRERRTPGRSRRRGGWPREGRSWPGRGSSPPSATVLARSPYWRIEMSVLNGRNLIAMDRYCQDQIFSDHSSTCRGGTSDPYVKIVQVGKLNILESSLWCIAGRRRVAPHPREEEDGGSCVELPIQSVHRKSSPAAGLPGECCRKVTLPTFFPGV